METKISVLLADPGEQYRAAYSKAIGQETDMELVAQTDNGLRAEELITKFQPDVVVLDLVLPNLDGLSLLTHLRAKNASSRVIVTSAICNDQVLMECAELGTTYFMQKPFDPPLLVQRIRQTARPRQRTGGAGTQLAAAEPEPSLESVVTDVIPCEVANAEGSKIKSISIANELAEAIYSVYMNEPVSNIFGGGLNL